MHIFQCAISSSNGHQRLFLKNWIYAPAGLLSHCLCTGCHVPGLRSSPGPEVFDGSEVTETMQISNNICLTVAIEIHFNDRTYRITHKCGIESKKLIMWSPLGTGYRNWCTNIDNLTRALLRLERTMNLLEGGKGGWGREGGEGTEGGWGGDVGERGRVEERGRVGREGGWGGVGR